MKILFVSAVLPYPLHSGGQIRIYNLLKRLSKKHEIYLYCFIRSDEEKQYLPVLSFCKRVVTVVRGRVWRPMYLIKTLISRYPLLWSSYNNRTMRSLLAEELSTGTYDLVHLEPGYVFPSLPPTKIPFVVCEHNIEHDVYMAYVRRFPIAPIRPLLLLDVAKMKLVEQRVWKMADAVVSVSAKDNAIIGGTVVSNGVDIKEFAFRPKKTWSQRVTFLYVGDFRWIENRDAAQHLIHDWWPHIEKIYRHAQLRIVGKNAPKGKYFVGQVERIQDELHGADIMLAPIHIGGGTKYKILEAMAAGLPVITTPVGIEGMDNRFVRLANSTDDVLRSIAWLGNDANRLKLLKNARSHVEQEYSWDGIAQKLDTLWNSLS